MNVAEIIWYRVVFPKSYRVNTCRVNVSFSSKQNSQSRAFDRRFFPHTFIHIISVGDLQKVLGALCSNPTILLKKVFLYLLSELRAIYMRVKCVKNALCQQIEGNFFAHSIYLDCLNYLFRKVYMTYLLHVYVNVFTYICPSADQWNRCEQTCAKNRLKYFNKEEWNRLYILTDNSFRYWLIPMKNMLTFLHWFYIQLGVKHQMQ